MRSFTSTCTFNPRLGVATILPILLLVLLFATTAHAQNTYNPINFIDSSNLCVGVPNTNTGTQLRLESCDDGDDNQMWERDNDLFRLKADTGRCARRTGGIDSSVVLADCDSGDSDQRWEVNNNDDFLIEAFDNGNYCWESMSGTSSGSLIEIQSCSTSNNDQRFDYGTYTEVQVRDDSNLCLSVPSTSTGSVLELQSCSSNNGQRMWRLDDDNNGLLRLRDNPSRCAALSSSSSGDDVELVSCDDGDSFHKWDFTSSNQLKSADNDRCMEYNSQNTGQDIVAFSCDDSNSDQEWRLPNYDNGGNTGDYMRYQVLGNSDYCLGVSSTNTNTDLDLFDCDDNDRRLWLLNSNDQLVLKADTNRCAERMGTGSVVELQVCDTGSISSNQRWQFDDNGDNQIETPSTSQCMEYNSESIGEEIRTESCSSSNGNQKWDRVDPGDDGDEYDLIQLRGTSNRCLGVDNTNSGTKVEVFECDDGNDNRLWYLDNNRKLRLRANTNRCATRDSSSSSSDNFIRIETCTSGNDDQEWTYNENNDYEFKSLNLCMQYDSTNLDTEIIARTCDGGSDQEFDFPTYQEVNPRGNSNRCLGVSSTDTGTLLELFECNGSDNRMWYHDGNDLLRLKANSNRCAERSSSSSGNVVRLQSCSSGSSSQQFRYDDAGDYELDSSNLCLQYNSEDIGEDIRAYTCDSGSDQEWEFDGTGGSGGTDGKVVFPNNGSDCDKCIGVNSASDISDGAYLRWVDCDASDSETVRWFDYPDTTSSGSFWCIVDNDSNDNLCVVPDSSSPQSGTRLKLASENSVTNEQTLLWYYNDSGNSVTDDITHWTTSSLCVGVASNGNDIEMQNCDDTQPRQSWDITDYDDQFDVCDDLGGGGGGSGRDPSATSPGSLIYVNNEDDCYDCIAITGCSQDNYNCDSARLTIANCFTADDFTYLKYWIQTPSDGSSWCSRDSDWCIRDDNGNLELVSSSVTGNQNLLWYYASNEIQPESSDQLCVASNGNEPFIESCTSNTIDNPKEWAITTFNAWSQTCDPLGRDPGSIPGMFIHVDTDSDCGWCIGVDTKANPMTIAMAPCIDSNDNYETSFKAGMVPSTSNRWCLQRDTSVCIKYDTTASNDLTVVSYTGHQSERWYLETTKEITPDIRNDMCFVWDSSRNVEVDSCTSFPTENRDWKIVNANAYSCDTLGVSSFGASSAAGLGPEIGRANLVVMALSSMAFAVVSLL